MIKKNWNSYFKTYTKLDIERLLENKHSRNSISSEFKIKDFRKIVDWFFQKNAFFEKAVTSVVPLIYKAIQWKFHRKLNEGIINV